MAATSGRMQRRDQVHRAWGAGRWYSADPGHLAADVDQYLDRADLPPLPGRIIGGMAPHAGFAYSGAVAGYTYRALRDQVALHGAPETVVVLGSCHRNAFPGLALLGGDALATPLGRARLDPEARALLVAEGRGLIGEDDAPHAGEHSAENQIPFLQRALPNVGLVIGLFGDHAPETITAATDALRALGRQRRIQVVSSTDLLHDADYDRVTATDRATLAMIGALDADGLERRWSPREQVCCGIGPVLTLLRVGAALGCRAATLLQYRNSGDEHPETRGEWVVGYGAAVLTIPS